MTLEAQLTEIETAISDILTKGQRVTIGDRTYDRADLATLRKMRSDMKAEINSSASGGGRTVCEF